MTTNNDGLKDEIFRKFDAGGYREYYAQELGELGKLNTSGWVRALCPFHDDTNPSLDVNFFREGAYNCHACGAKGDIFTFHQRKHGGDFKEALKYFANFLGINPTKKYKKAKLKFDYDNPDEVYHYRDLNGKIVHETLRFSKPIKNFSQRRPDPAKKGKYIYTLKGIEVIPYNLKELVNADQVLFVEGEKDVQSLQKIGLVATTNPMGAEKWFDSLTPYFKDKSIILLPDNDEPGRNHAKLVSNHLYNVAKSIKIINLPGLKEGGDVTDWLKTGNKETLVALIKAQRPYKDHIDFLNEKHAVIMVGGKCVVLNEGVDPISEHPMVTFSGMHDFEIRYANRKIPNPKAGQKGQRKEIPITSDWKGSSRRRQYNGIVFAPGRDISGYYNWWRGFTVEPKSGDVKPYLDHIKLVICNNNEELFGWVIDWFADIYRNPGGKLAGSCLVTCGKKGTGKGLLTEPHQRILGSHFVPVTGENEFLGPFNSHTARAIIIYANEAFWAGRKIAEGQLKARITERTLLMNEKFLPAIQITNHARIIMASNEPWVVPATKGERRFCVLGISDNRKGDVEYFDRMFKWCEDKKNLAALLYFFQNREITSNLRQPPITQCLADQIELSMDSVGKFWLDCLDAGHIDGGDTDNPDGFGGWVKSGDVFDQYVKFCNDTGERHREANNNLTKELKNLCEKIENDKHTFCSGRVRALKIPNLDHCRADYNTKIGIDRFAVPAVRLVSSVTH